MYQNDKNFMNDFVKLIQEAHIININKKSKKYDFDFINETPLITISANSKNDFGLNEVEFNNSHFISFEKEKSIIKQNDSTYLNKKISSSNNFFRNKIKKSLLKDNLQI